MKYHSQGNLTKEAFNWGLAYSFKELVHGYHGGECRGRQAGRDGTGGVAENSYPDLQAGGRENETGSGLRF